MMRTDRPVRIANCSGFYGDRMSALEEQVRGGDVDVITGDYLAEVTMLILAKVRSKRPDQGYATTFLRQLDPVLEEVASRQIKIVVNAGGLNPGGLAEATRSLLKERNLELRVAHIVGDDITDRLVELQQSGHELPNLDTGKPLSSWGHEPVCANAYLGGFGVKRALDEGADIVITGRTTDAALVVGSAAWWWDWQPTDFDRLAGAVAAGHIIECGAQATGGNFSGFTALEDALNPGFPIAELAIDGTSTITKHTDTGGAVTVDTVTAQLLYEIGDPAYLNPDVTTHLDTVQLRGVGPDRVEVSGVRGSPPPTTTKVSVCAIDGWRNAVTLVLTGVDIDDKADFVRRAVEDRFAGREGVDELRFDRIGQPVPDPDDQLLGSCLLNISIRGDEQVVGRSFSSAITELGLSNFPGYYGTAPPGNGMSRGVYWPALIGQDVLDHCVVMDDGVHIPVPPPPGKDIEASTPVQEEALPLPQSTVAVPLGSVFNARSGDKGGNANLGIWSRDSMAFAWLRDHFTLEDLLELLPELRAHDVSRYVLPNLGAVNFVVRGILDEGAASTLRFDKQAKALGEWVRSRTVNIPPQVLEGGGRDA